MKSTSLNDRLGLESTLERSIKRSLVPKGAGIDFTSNDYLGITRSEAVKTRVLEMLSRSPLLPITGSGASRLLGGDTDAIRNLEEFLAEFHLGDASLVFPSGYQTNVTLYSSLPTRHDTVFFDALVHASIRDGIRLSNANSYSFRHNDVGDLRKKIRESAKGKIFIAVEALYSMEGDFAPLKDLQDLMSEYECISLIDEAHSTGIYGAKGEGIVASQGIEEPFPIRVHTFGKAIGAQGGAVVGSALLKELLVSKGRGFIYTTGVAPLLASAIRVCYDAVIEASEERQSLFSNVETFRSLAMEGDLPLIGDEKSPIQGILISDPERGPKISAALLEKGFFVRHILPPTVEAGKERLRIILHSDHKKDDLSRLVSTLKEIL